MYFSSPNDDIYPPDFFFPPRNFHELFEVPTFRVNTATSSQAKL